MTYIDELIAEIPLWIRLLPALVMGAGGAVLFWKEGRYTR